MNDSLLLRSAEIVQSVIEHNGGKIVFLSQIDEQSHISHDIDIVIDDQGWQSIPVAIDALKRKFNLELLQIIQYDVDRSIYCVFFRSQNSVHESVKIDFLNDSNGIGIYGINTDKLLSETVFENQLRRPSNEHELAYLLVKKIVKGYIDDDQFSRICLLDSLVSYKYLPNICISGIRNCDWAKLIMCLRKRDISLFRAEIIRIHRVWKVLRYLTNLKYTSWRLLKKAIRMKGRILYPVGLDVYFANAIININEKAKYYLVQQMATPFRNRIEVLPPKSRMAFFLRFYYLICGYLIINLSGFTRPKFILRNSTLTIQNEAIEEVIITLKKRASQRLKVFFPD